MMKKVGLSNALQGHKVLNHPNESKWLEFTVLSTSYLCLVHRELMEQCRSVLFYVDYSIDASNLQIGLNKRSDKSGEDV